MATKRIENVCFALFSEHNKSNGEEENHTKVLTQSIILIISFIVVITWASRLAWTYLIYRIMMGSIMWWSMLNSSYKMSSRCTVSCWRVVQISPFYYAHAQRCTYDETWDKILFQVELCDRFVLISIWQWFRWCGKLSRTNITPEIMKLSQSLRSIRQTKKWMRCPANTTSKLVNFNKSSKRQQQKHFFFTIQTRTNPNQFEFLWLK